MHSFIVDRISCWISKAGGAKNLPVSTWLPRLSLGARGIASVDDATIAEAQNNI
jgi:hypothetical protein